MRGCGREEPVVFFFLGRCQHTADVIRARIVHVEKAIFCARTLMIIDGYEDSILLGASFKKPVHANSE